MRINIQGTVTGRFSSSQPVRTNTPKPDTAPSHAHLYADCSAIERRAAALASHGTLASPDSYMLASPEQR